MQPAMQERIPCTFHSQHGEDQWLWSNAHKMELPMRGIYVDVGASNGIHLSNTYWLEQLGWRGLCIEPNPTHYHSLPENRKGSAIDFCAVGASPRPFYVTPVADHSGFLRQGHTGAQPIEVAVKTLDQAITDAGIHPMGVALLSIDTEGTEIEVWNTRPLCFRPSVVIMEHDTIGQPSHLREIIVAMRGDFYEPVHQTKGNVIFKSKTQLPLGA